MEEPDEDRDEPSIVKDRFGGFGFAKGAAGVVTAGVEATGGAAGEGGEDDFLIIFSFFRLAKAMCLLPLRRFIIEMRTPVEVGVAVDC
jgi:hypothetical protein